MKDSYLSPRATCWPVMGKSDLPQCPSAPLRWPQEKWNADDSVSQGNSSSGPRSLLTEAERNLFLADTKKHRLTHTHSQSAVAMLMPGPLWACLALMWVESCSAHSLFTCEPIHVHRCLGMPYNMTFFPNMMEHYDQDIAASQMEVHQFVDVILADQSHWLQMQTHQTVGYIVIIYIYVIYCFLFYLNWSN